MPILDPHGSRSPTVDTLPPEESWPWCRPINGCLPNFSMWRPGDVLLFSSSIGGRDFTGELIEFLQQTACPDVDRTHTQWVHAAIYLGDGLCVEAVMYPSDNTDRSGVLVATRSLSDRIQSSYVKVMRLSDGAPISDHSPPPLPTSLQQRIVAAALNHTGYRYPALSQFLVHFLQANLARLLQKHPTLTAPLSCAHLCRQALAAASGIDVYGTWSMFPYPCTLSASSELSPVPAYWRQAI